MALADSNTRNVLEILNFQIGIYRSIFRSSKALAKLFTHERVIDGKDVLDIDSQKSRSTPFIQSCNWGEVRVMVSILLIATFAKRPTLIP
jgi:hypothetical protein